MNANSQYVRGKKTSLWITKPVLREMKKRDSAHKKAKKLDSADIWGAFRSLRNKAVAALRRSKQVHFQEIWRNSGQLTIPFQVCTTVFHLPSLMDLWKPHPLWLKSFSSILILFPVSPLPLSLRTWLLRLLCLHWSALVWMLWRL